MLVRRISYYDEFICLQGACPQSCCKGWRIPLDDRAIRRFRKEKGLLGLELKLAMHGKAQPSFSPYCIRCPFLRLDGRCDMQLRKGERYLADICRVYPRIIACPGPYAELQLDLSCVHVAELFLAHADAQYFVEEESDAEYERTGDNEDMEYLAEALDAALRKLAAFGGRVQDRMMREGISEAEALAEGAELLKSEATDLPCFPLPIALLNDLMSTDFYQDALRYVLPFLYKLCKMYYRHFDKLSYEQGEKELQRMFAKYSAEKPQRVHMYAAYYKSCLLRTYMECYEDYSFLKHILLGVIGSNMIMLFDLLWHEKYGKTADEDLAKIISVCERRIYHNEAVGKEMMKLLIKRSDGI